MDSDTFRLLKRTTRILINAAEFYLLEENVKIASKARKLLFQSSGRNDMFHPTIASMLVELEDKILHADPATVSEAAVKSMVSLLASFENLMEQQSRSYHRAKECHPQARYPGLEFLQDMFNEQASGKQSSLGYRKFLYCPDLDMRRKLKTDVKDCYDELARIRSANADLDKDDQHDPRESKVAGRVFRHAARVRKLLLKYWRCGCKSSHQDVKVAFTAPSKILLEEGVVASCSLCWPLLDTTSASPLTPAIHVMEQTDQIPIRRRVVFRDIDDEAEESVQATNICEAVQMTNGQGNLRVSETCLSTTSAKPDVRQSDQLICTAHSLKTSLDSRADSQLKFMSPRDRLAIAVSLAYSYLYLSDTDWWPLEESNPDFWFLRGKGLSDLLTWLPFFRFQTQSTSSRANCDANKFNKARPSLPALGKIILELWKGSKVEWGPSFDATLEACRIADFGEKWFLAIEACIEIDFDGPLGETPKARSDFVKKVVLNLHYLFEFATSLRVDDLFAALQKPLTCDSRVNQIAFDQIVDQSNVSGAPKDGNSYCLHDGNNWENSNQPEVRAAQKWFHDLRKVHDILRPDSDPVKVAIVDTGAQFSNNSSTLYPGQPKQVRTWVGRECGRDGQIQHLGDDMDGHGTHVTSVFLETYPLGDVYVAKVFDGRNEEQGEAMASYIEQRIADAIEYAVSVWKVQIISMSFGYQQPVAMIKKAIHRAQRSNVLFFAAASNCGGNGLESWPACLDTVFSIYATDGDGNKYGRNPTPLPGGDNFATVGSHVNAMGTNGEHELRSGTSIATPVAAGIASIVIHLLRQERNNIDYDDYDDLLARLSEYSGMLRLFRTVLGGAPRDGYRYITPWKLSIVDRLTITRSMLDELRKV